MKVTSIFHKWAEGSLEKWALETEFDLSSIWDGACTFRGFQQGSSTLPPAPAKQPYFLTFYFMSWKKAMVEHMRRKTTFYGHHVHVTTSDRGFKLRACKGTFWSHKSYCKGDRERGEGAPPHPHYPGPESMSLHNPGDLKTADIGHRATRRNWQCGCPGRFLQVPEGLTWTSSSQLEEETHPGEGENLEKQWVGVQ